MSVYIGSPGEDCVCLYRKSRRRLSVYIGSPGEDCLFI